MEEKLTNKHDFLEVIKRGLSLNDIDAQSYSPLTLAYIGDDAYDLVIRTYLLSRGNMPAETQSSMMDVIEPLLDEEELAVYKRGRNAKSNTKAKNATVADYRRATGFEALMGYLYLKGSYERMVQLIGEAMPEV